MRSTIKTAVVTGIATLLLMSVPSEAKINPEFKMKLNTNQGVRIPYHGLVAEINKGRTNSIRPLPSLSVAAFFAAYDNASNNTIKASGSKTDYIINSWYHDKELAQTKVGHNLSHFYSIHFTGSWSKGFKTPYIDKVVTDSKVRFIGFGSYKSVTGKQFNVIFVYGVK